MGVQNVNLSPRAMNRSVGKVPQVIVKNRFVETNPVSNDTSYSFITRPGMKKWLEVGEGPIRKVYSQPGVFSDDLFTVSGTFLYRVNNLGEARLLGELSTNPLGNVSMAATAPIGEGSTAVAANLFIAEGGVLWVYTEDGAATARLEVSGPLGVVTNGDQVELNGIYYQFTSGDVDAGTPDGSSGNPWLVNVASEVSADLLQNLFRAINTSGVAGTDYSTDTDTHPTMSASVLSSTDIVVVAKIPGIQGNAYTVTETSGGLAWSSATLVDGGEEQLRQVEMPQGYGAISVAHIQSYVIVIPVQDEELGTNGRFYWIEPGELSVDTLNFATAERSPDKLHQVVVFSDMFWLCGENTTEPWITTGNIEAPMERFQGILFDRGSWEGTAIQVKDSLILVDEDGSAFQIQGGLNRISTPQVEEKIRKAIQVELLRTVD